ncbi:hypothetical protein Sipo8835_08900 [Streptomyces ipomoeae]|uniref:Uncharacterized protein n=1 Tax=Streptomyces ipomoeae TaxID=103232 RepID=A0AAE8W505_9ACTN|nr:hypothetical protein Sipo8835_08900 [Streptomyces ipomoeae]TQE40334.1 hypothetical protein Sipo7851_01400 [Streptomyces ipomoeae]
MASRRPARPLAAPGTSPSTSSTRACARHAESTLPHSRLRSSGRGPHDAAPSPTEIHQKDPSQDG